MWPWKLHGQVAGLTPLAQEVVATAGSTGHRHRLQKGARGQTMVGKEAEQVG